MISKTLNFVISLTNFVLTENLLKKRKKYKMKNKILEWKYCFIVFRCCLNSSQFEKKKIQ